MSEKKESILEKFGNIYISIRLRNTMELLYKNFRLKTLYKAFLFDKAGYNFRNLGFFFGSSRDQDYKMYYLENVVKWKFDVSHVLVIIFNLAIKYCENYSSLPSIDDLNNDIVCLDQRECSYLLAASFFGLIGDDLNFKNLFFSENNFLQDIVKIEKINCIFNYFDSISKKNDYEIGHVLFYKQSISMDEQILLVDLPNCNILPNYPILFKKSIIHNVDENFLNVLFSCKQANFFNIDACQIIYKMCCYPELLLGYIFDKYSLSSCIFIYGVERFNTIEEGNQIKWLKPYNDRSQFRRDYITEHFNIRPVEFVYLDFIPYQDKYCYDSILNNLKKCLVAFRKTPISSRMRYVSTGNWGMETGNDFELAFLIQLIASSISRSKIVYHTSNNNFIHSLLNRLNEDLLIFKNVGKIFDNFCLDYLSRNEQPKH